MSDPYFPSLKDIMTAEHTLNDILVPTPLMKNRNLSDKYEANIFLKREDLQMVRSYKIRGAYNKIKSLTPEEMEKGVVCASAGNHAQGVAFSCSKLGIQGKIYMPVTTPRQKINQVKMFGGKSIEVVLTEILSIRPIQQQSKPVKKTIWYLSLPSTIPGSSRGRQPSV
ncbi:MAG: pyridoxal-phosphate dependent enzyme [Odoribacter splanchnicus]